MEPLIREIALVSLNVSLKRRSVKEITLGNLAVNLMHLSKFLSKKDAYLSKVREIYYTLER